VQKLASADLAKEEPDMGKPAPDGPVSCAAANPTTAVDVYLVDGPAATVSRTAAVTGAGNYAVTVPGNCADGTCSGFVLLNVRATTLKRDFVDSILVHEMFHVLEYARMSAWLPQWPWPTEADATWAQGHYEPSNPEAAQYLQNWYASFQQDSPFRDLGERCGGCEYQYWIWPFFMTQEGKSVPEAWKAVAGAKSDAEVNERLNGYFPFADHFRDFAVRDLNVDYHEQGGAAGRRFQTGSGGWAAIPALQTPRRDSGLVQLQDTHDQKRDFGLVTPISLDFETQRFELPSKDKLRRVSMDFSALGPNVDVDLLVHVVGKDGLEHRRVTGQTFTFCRDDPGDDIDAFAAVYSDHSLQGEFGRDIKLSYRGRTYCKPAVTEWKGPWTSRYTSSQQTWTMSSTADFVFDPAQSASTYWVYPLAPNTPAQASVTGQDSDCSWSGSGTVMTSGSLEVIDPHSPDAYYGPNASSTDTIPVHWSCQGQPDFTMNMTADGEISGRDTFSTDLTELDHSFDDHGTGEDRVTTWNLSAAATGVAP
jgi:hypothetical protein